MIIRQDGISIAFSVVAISELLFLTTFGGQLFSASILAASLLLAGITFDLLTNKSKIPEDANADNTQKSSIATYAGLGIAVYFGLSIFVPTIPPQYKTFLAVTSLSSFTVSQLFNLLIAVSEEQFFRGFVANYLIRYLGPFGFPAAGAVFAVYHLAVYGDSPTNLLIVFGAGTTLAFIAWKTGLVSPTIIAHVTINAFASGILSGAPTIQMIVPLTVSVVIPTLVFWVPILALKRLNNKGIGVKLS